jgi:hypothetical protein
VNIPRTFGFRDPARAAAEIDHTGWQLQCQTNSLTGTWVNVSAPSTTNQMTIPLDTDNGSVFFRLICP